MWLINKVNSKNFVALRNLRFGAERALSREIGYAPAGPASSNPKATLPPNANSSDELNIPTIDAALLSTACLPHERCGFRKEHTRVDWTASYLENASAIF